MVLIMANKTKKSAGVTYDTDGVAKNLLPLLIKDFQLTEGRDFAHQAARAFALGPKSFRNYKFPEIGVIPVPRFKRYHQLQNLYKKYRFGNDAYSDVELDQSTVGAYLDNQVRLATILPLKSSSLLVIRRARQIIKEILGKYDPESTLYHCRFGRKSSIGCPLSLAYIDHKLTDVRAFTGSSECSSWFLKDYLPGDPLLASIVRPLLKNDACDLEHDSLNLVLVPKSWKTLRPITPLTLLSLFYSYGIGGVITEKLKSIGLDIASLQNRHRQLVKRFSRRKHTDHLGGTHATADLKSASDSLTSELLNRLLPRDWYCACRKTFTHQMRINEVPTYVESVLPMGNGLTFPMETLIFYSLIKAIGDLTGTKGIYSVYGDDLIYPSGIHRYVYYVFNNLKLVLNGDKTFSSAPFRESCGEDYYRGVGVRPFFLPAENHSFPRSRYMAWLHTTINGLLRRWDATEIPWTLRFLYAELQYVSGRPLLRVPPSFPDTSGVKVDRPTDIPTPLAVWEPIRVNFSHGSRWFCFKYLMSSSDTRFVEAVTPYYWLALQGLSDDIPDKNFWDVDFSFYSESPQSSLHWTVVKRLKFKTSTGRTIVKKKYQAVCTARSKFLAYRQTKARRDSVSDWT